MTARRPLACLLAFAGLVLVRPPVASAAAPVVVVDGSGWGHGVGMAQDGAYWMGRAGTDTAGILRRFYPGTRPARTGGSVRVAITTVPSGGALLAFPAGGEIRESATGVLAPGFPMRIPPGGQVSLRFEDGRYRAERLPGGPPDPDVPSTVHPLRAVPVRGGTVALPATGRRYRGAIEASGLPGGDGLRLVNELDVESYLRGMGEVRDPSWPPAALRAQAIAARTYALRAMAAGGEICADERCQVYLGQQAEYGAMDEAVARTAGQVLMFDGRLASTFYSANGGGVSATREEGFGTAAGSSPEPPYLRAVPYPTGDPDRWSVSFAAGEAASRLHYPGALSAVTVARAGPSGRVLTVALDGTAGGSTVTGREFAQALGLRSTLFRVRVGAGGESSVPPPAAPLQLPPDETAALPGAVAGPSWTGVAGSPPAGSRPSTAAPLRAAPVRRRASGDRDPWWPEVLMGVALVGCLVLRHHARDEGVRWQP